jgi:hypothetical protein
MGPWGAVIMSFFGGVFFAAASVMASGWKTPLLLIPLLVFAVITTLAARRIKHAPPGSFEPDARSGRIISWASIAEGIGIPAMAMVLANTHHNDILLPGIALVVGLHFVPMAYAIPFRPFYLLAALLILAAVAGSLLKQPPGSIMAGISASLALWVASAFALSRKPASLT